MLIAAAGLLVGLAVAARFAWRFRDAACGLVIVGAYAGIVVKEPGSAPVAVAAGPGALVVAALVVRSLTGRDRSGAATAAAAAA